MNSKDARGEDAGSNGASRTGASGVSASSTSSTGASGRNAGKNVRVPAPGMTASGVPESSGVDLARQALTAAKEQARARGAAAQQRRTVRRGGSLRSGSGADGRDPLKLGAALDRLKTERGWEMPIAVSGVMGRWKDIVGPDVAQHSEPLKFDEDERILVVRCDSTAWATQLKWMVPELLRRLNGELGRDTVRRITLQGPNAPQRRYGPLRAPGSTGPGDTYG